MSKQITSIELFNFQKHSHKKIELSPSINVLVGSSDAGKSAFLKALRWVFTNGISTEAVRKTGTSETKVIITYSDGTIITKIRSATLNKYIFNHNGEEKVFNSVGIIVPKEIKDFTGIDLVRIDKDDFYLNEAKQKELFLINEKTTTIGKLVDTLTGNSIITDIFKNLNTQILSFNREIKSLQLKSDTLSNDRTKVLAERKEKELLYNKVHPIIDSILLNEKTLENYKKVYKEYINAKSKLEESNKELASIKLVDSNKINITSNLIDGLVYMKGLLSNFNICIVNKDRIAKELADIKTTTVDLEVIKGKLETLNIINKNITEFTKYRDLLFIASSEKANIKIDHDLEPIKAKTILLENLKKCLQNYHSCDNILKSLRTQLDSITFEDLLSKKEELLSRVKVQCPKCSHDLGYDDLKSVL